MMYIIGTKIILPLRLCAKRSVKYTRLNVLLNNKEFYCSIFVRNFQKINDNPNQSDSFKKALEFVLAHPYKSIQSKKLNIQGLQLCWALGVFLNNKEAYPFVSHSESPGEFTESWINENIFESKYNISKRQWIALEKEVKNISVSDLRHLIKILPKTLK